jgi:flagellar biosynthetic protein FlhB
MADSGDNAQEKTEPATPKRLDEAKRKGQVARSRELTTSALLLAAAGGLLALGPGLVTRLLDLMRAALRTNPVADGAPGVEQALLEAMADALLAVAPFLALSAVVATLAPLALGGWVLSPEAIAFKWEKLDPIKGLGRVFSWRGLMELTKALAKFTLILSVTGLVLWLARDHFLVLGISPVHAAIKQTLGAVMLVFMALASSTLLIAAVDVPFQIWSHARQLRMSRQEVRDELKETEGKPEVKGRIRSLQREIAPRRMMEELPKADVVVTNPSHYASHRATTSRSCPRRAWRAPSTTTRPWGGRSRQPSTPQWRRCSPTPIACAGLTARSRRPSSMTCPSPTTYAVSPMASRTIRRAEHG